MPNSKPYQCKICGCTDEHACAPRFEGDAPCHWISEDLCSHCADHIEEQEAARRSAKASQMPAFGNPQPVRRRPPDSTRLIVIRIITAGPYCGDECPYRWQAQTGAAYCNAFREQRNGVSASKRLSREGDIGTKRLGECIHAQRIAENS